MEEVKDNADKENLQNFMKKKGDEQWKQKRDIWEQSRRDRKKGAVIVSNRKKEEVTNLVFPKAGILLL